MKYISPFTSSDNAVDILVATQNVVCFLSHMASAEFSNTSCGGGFNDDTADGLSCILHAVEESLEVARDLIEIPANEQFPLQRVPQDAAIDRKDGK